MMREPAPNRAQSLNGGTLSITPNGSPPTQPMNGSPSIARNGQATPTGPAPAVEPSLLEPLGSRDLYSLLPAIYRVRDAATGEQLRALLGIIDSELRVLESNIEALYENEFIETCEAWVVPYIGDLLAVSDLSGADPRSLGQESRAYVANTLAYRQRKGTTPILEQLARDITGWGARAQEMLPLVATTQNVNHLRSQTTVDLRQRSLLQRAGSPFETNLIYSTEISRPRRDRGQYSPTSVTLFLWRLQTYAVEGGTPLSIPPPNSAFQGHYFTFHPLKQDRHPLASDTPEEHCIPLFNPPQTETELSTLAREINVPGQLTSTLLQEWLQTYPPDRAPVRVFVNRQQQPYHVADLRTYQPAENTGLPPIVVDPERGALAFFTETPPNQVEVNYHYGFSGNVGAGTYERSTAITKRPRPSRQVVWRVSETEGKRMNTLEQTIKTWNRYATRWQRCADWVYLPVAQLRVGESEVHRIDQDDLRSNSNLSPTLQPGILQGLQVVAPRGEIDAVVLPGVAVDAQGQVIQLSVRFPVLVGCYRNQSVLVLIWRPQRDWEPHWQVIAVPEAQADRYPASQYLRLGRLQVDENGRIAGASNQVRSPFRPGFSGSFTLSLSRTSEGAGIGLVASPGAFAVNRDGQKISLGPEASTTIKSLNPELFLVFLRFDVQAQKGKLEAVPDYERVIIELQGNRTYRRNLALQIPVERQLYLTSSNGDRPHLLGNLRVRGMAPPSTENAGDLYLEGLLVEGGLTVLPGNLQRLQLTSTTLVPQGPGLVVQKAEYEVVDENPEDVTLLGILMYSLMLLRRLLRVGLADNGLSTQERIAQLSRIAQQQLATLFEGIYQVLQQWQSVPPPKDEFEHEDEDHLKTVQQGCATLCEKPGEDVVNLDEDNSLLSVTLHRSICGAIALADTVPELHITESIIDPGQADFRQGGITAPGTDVTLNTSTLLGTLTARSLDAENSILCGKANVTLRQMGCLRFCYVPEGSRTPRRHRCQPDLFLSQQLTELPAAIAALTTHPDSGQVFAATRGKGVLQFLEAGQVWVPLNSGLRQLTVTALLAISSNGSGTVNSSANADRLMGTNTRFMKEVNAGDLIRIRQKPYWVLEVVSDQEIRLGTALEGTLQDETFTIDTLMAGTADGVVLRAISQLQIGLGSVSGHSSQSTLSGSGTFFLRDVRPGDDLLLIGQTATGTVIESRTVTGVSSDQTLTMNAALESDRLNHSFLVRRRVWTPIFARPGVNTPITAIAAFPVPGSANSATQPLGLLIGTDGNGIFRSTQGGNTWDEQSPTLINQDIRAIVHHPTRRRLLAGTWGNGVLISSDQGLTWTRDPEVRQTGLTTPTITALLVNPLTQDIFAGTAGGGVFRSTDGGDRWTPMNRGLTRLSITALAAFSRTHRGTLSSHNTEVIGVETHFLSELSVGDLLTLNGQSRTILEIRSDHHLLIHDAFDPDIRPGTSFQTSTILAGTTSGAVFRSTSNGRTWNSVGDLTRTDITALAVQLTSPGPSASSNPVPTVLVGTQMGSLYRSQDRGDRWIDINSGIANIDLTLQILNQVQPRFTADRFGLPAYAQLSTVCPVEIRTGAEDGAEMGAFHYLKQPQREANLQTSLREYLRFGLQSSTLFIT